MQNTALPTANKNESFLLSGFINKRMAPAPIEKKYDDNNVATTAIKKLMSPVYHPRFFANKYAPAPAVVAAAIPIITPAGELFFSSVVLLVFLPELPPYEFPL